MSRQCLEDEILYQRRYLKSLEETKTNCLSCGKKKYDKPVCLKHGQIPPSFLISEDCPDWEYESIPF